jgi:Polyketide cyclase / dehydrase and lipid transport
MRLLLRLFGLLLLLLVVLVALAFALPDRAHVERSITIARPQSQIYLLMSNLRRFNEWSPWYARDPQASYTFSGPESGVGAKLSWSSRQRDVGEGSQTIIAVAPDEAIALQLDFGPMGQPKARYELRTVNSETLVTWSLDSELPLHLDGRFGWNLVGRYMGLFMDRMVGPDFEHGLENLRALANTFPNVDIAGIAPQLLDLPERKLVYVSVSAAGDEAALLRAWEMAQVQVRSFLAQHRLSASGPALALFAARDSGAWQFDAALPAQYDLMPEDSDVRGRVIGAGRGVQISVTGGLSERLRQEQKLRAWLQVRGLRASGPLVEEYGEGGNVLQGPARLSLRLQD